MRGGPSARTAQLLTHEAALPALIAAAGSFDLIYKRRALLATGAMRHAAAKGLPAVLEVNAPLLDEQARHRTLARAGDAAAMTARAMAAATRVVCVSGAVAGHAHALGARAPLVVPNGVDPGRFADRPHRDCPFTAGFICKL